MNKFENFDVYKLSSPKFKGYIFSIQEQTDEEPIYHYYFINIEQGKQPSIRKPNNIIDLLHIDDLVMTDINEQPDEFQTFATTMEEILKRPLISLEKNLFFTNVNQEDLQILKRN